MWFPIENFDKMPLTVSKWQTGRIKETDKNQEGTTESAEHAHEVVWYSAENLELGEVMIFDGHFQVMHDAVYKGGLTNKERSTRFSVEMRIRCKCRGGVCGDPEAPMDDMWPWPAPTDWKATEIGVMGGGEAAVDKAETEAISKEDPKLKKATEELEKAGDDVSKIAAAETELGQTKQGAAEIDF